MVGIIISMTSFSIHAITSKWWSHVTRPLGVVVIISFLLALLGIIHCADRRKEIWNLEYQSIIWHGGKLIIWMLQCESTDVDQQSVSWQIGASRRTLVMKIAQRGKGWIGPPIAIAPIQLSSCNLAASLDLLMSSPLFKHWSHVTCHTVGFLLLLFAKLCNQRMWLHIHGSIQLKSIVLNGSKVLEWKNPGSTPPSLHHLASSWTILAAL